MRKSLWSHFFGTPDELFKFIYGDKKRNFEYLPHPHYFPDLTSADYHSFLKFNLTYWYVSLLSFVIGIFFKKLYKIQMQVSGIIIGTEEIF